jgi:ParB family chromosome partitioning protein
MGVRENESHPTLSPIPHAKDTGRKPIRNVGTLSVDQIVPDPAQPRLEFSEEALDHLAASLIASGQLSPIRVRWSEELQKWVIIAGERRWRATKRAGLPTITCTFHEDPLSQSEILEQQLVENLLREDVKPIEQAKAFAALIELNGWTAKEVGETLNVPASTISRALALLRLPEEIQAQVDAGDLAARSAYEISKLSEDDDRRALAEDVAAKRLTHQETAKVVRRRRGKRATPNRGTKQVFSTDEGFTVTNSARNKCNYFEIEEALEIVLAEVRHRIQNNVQLF